MATDTQQEACLGSRDKIVVAVDGSKEASEAIEWYVGHMHRDGNELILVYAMDIPSMPTRESWENQTGPGKKKKEQLEQLFGEKLSALKITWKFIADAEKPGDLICRVAQKENATAIVMGTRGMGSIKRTFMGSVSDYVVHHALCPVLVYRNK